MRGDVLIEKEEGSRQFTDQDGYKEERVAAGKLLGHRDIHATRIYADVVMETKTEAISRIPEYFRCKVCVIFHTVAAIIVVIIRFFVFCFPDQGGDATTAATARFNKASS